LHGVRGATAPALGANRRLPYREEVSSDVLDVAGIILSGGKSRRMGLPKPTLPFGPESMIERVVRLLGDVAYPLLVVASPGQQLPRLTADVQVVRDRREGRGPLEGICAGLEALQSQAQAAYITGCDVPRLVPGIVRLLVNRLGDHQIAVPVDGSHYHPLAAVYRVNVLPAVQELLAADRLRPVFLFDEVDTCRVPVEDLRAVDPHLSTLENLNHPADYLAALDCCGFSIPDTIRRRLSAADQRFQMEE
jgi:molybdopterin-guanine dinucleotide biosynthesis protein A